MKLKTSKLLMSLIGLVIFVIIIRNIDIIKLIKILSNINIILLIVILFLRLIFVFIKSLSWNILLRSLKIKTNLVNTFKIYSIGLFIGSATPGRVGDITRIFYINNKNKKEKIIPSIISIIIDRLFDLFILIFLGYISMITLSRYFTNQLLNISIILAISFVFIILLLINQKLTKLIKHLILKIFIPKKYIKNIKLNYHNFILNIKTINRKLLIYSLLISLFSWSVYYFQMYLVAMSLNINISFLYIIVCISISGLVNLIPISISGIGTREAALIFLFSIIGLSSEQAVSYSFIYLFLIAFAAFIGFVFWQQYNFKK